MLTLLQKLLLFRAVVYKSCAYSFGIRALTGALSRFEATKVVVMPFQVLTELVSLYPPKTPRSALGIDNEVAAHTYH